MRDCKAEPGCKLKTSEGKSVMPPSRPATLNSLRIGHPLPFELTALLLQGGGAMGSYQAGVYQALAETGLHPDWVAGISIGAVNAALIAGNPPEKRVVAVHTFSHPEVLQRPDKLEGDRTFDFTDAGRSQN
jgi:predicted acylesterase/phospholipase RssA